MDSGAPGRLRFELAGGAGEIASCVERIELFLVEAGCGETPAMQMAVVAEELLTNIVREAWQGGKAGYCSVDIETMPACDGVNVKLRTEDDGMPFDPMTVELPDLDASLEEHSIGGLGVYLVKSFTDKQVYFRDRDRNIFEVSKLCVATQPDI